MEKRRLYYFWFILHFFLFFMFTLSSLSAHEVEAYPIIEHIPISTFTYGEKIEIKVTVKEEVEWMKFFFRYQGVKQFQIRNIKKENTSYVYEYDTSKLPGLEFEYYLAVKINNKISYYPLNAPEEFFKVVGESEEPLPEIPEEFPSPIEEEKKVRLPLSINGSIQNSIAEKNPLPDEKKTNASGNLRIFQTYSKGNFTVDFDSNFNYSNTPLPEDSNFDLSNMMLSVSKDNHTLRTGDINVNESEFTVYGLGRRGIEYTFNNQRAYFHLFDVSSQQPKGFKGFVVPKSDISILGGVAGYKVLNETISFKAIYLTGNDDPNKGVNVETSPLFQSRKGNVMSLVEETRLFENKLNLKAEFARSSYDENLEDDMEAVSDNAYNIGGTFSYGVINIGANYKYIGKEFNSIGYQYLTNDRKGYVTNIAFAYKRFNLTGAYIIQQDNVKDDPIEYTTKDKNVRVNLSLGISENVSLNLGYRRDKQNTCQDEMEIPLQDSLSDEYSAGLNLYLTQSASINISLINSDSTSENAPGNDTSSLTLNLGGSFRAGENLSFNPSFGYAKMTNKFTNEQTLTYNSFLTTEIAFIPRIFSILFSGSFNRAELASDNISNVLDLSGGFNLYLEKLIKIGRIILSLRGNYKYIDMAGITESDYRMFFQCDFSF